MEYELLPNLRLPEGWTTVRLGEIATKLRSGATPKGGSRSYLPYRSKYRLIRSQNVHDHYFDDSGLANISDDQARDLAGAELEENDVLLNITGDGVTFGRVCIVPKRVLPACVNQHVMLIRLDKTRCLPEYLLAWLTLPQTKKYIESFNSGGSRRAITKGHVESFVVPLPPLLEQKAIAELVSVLNRRIELLHETNKTLESIAQAIFKSWFIDFDPVHAKAEGREPDGMDAATAALFPSEFEESELGQVPKGWWVMTLGEALEVNPRRELPKGVEAPYLDMANTPTAGHRPLQIMQRVAGSGVKFVNGDTLLAKITPSLENGKTAYVDFLQDGEVGWGSTEFIVLRPKPPLPPFFGYLLARHPAFRAFATQAMSGTSGRQRVEVSRLVQYRIVVPDAAVAEAFGRLIEPMRARIAAADEQAQTLAELRDTLLPRLISGKLRIPEAQEAVEEALS